MPMQYGRLRQDDDGHWYLIPTGSCKEFRELLDAIQSDDYDASEKAEDKFIKYFEKYRLSGGYQDLIIPMEQKYK
jgi:hypothetical protein